MTASSDGGYVTEPVWPPFASAGVAVTGAYLLACQSDEWITGVDG